MARSAVHASDGVRTVVPRGAPAKRAAEPRTTAESCNEVRLVGRLRGLPEERELPSGDVLTAFRLVVERAPSGRRLPEGVRPVSIDTLPCVAWSAGLRRSAAAWQDGDLVEVTGALRRRFWRTGGGTASQTEVEVASARRLRRAPADDQGLRRPGGRG